MVDGESAWINSIIIGYGAVFFNHSLIQNTIEVIRDYPFDVVVRGDKLRDGIKPQIQIDYRLIGTFIGLKWYKSDFLIFKGSTPKPSSLLFNTS